MSDRLPLRVPIESFLIIRDAENQQMDRIVYLDPQGKRHEKPVKRALIEEAFSKIDGQPRSICRSTGGLMIAQPYQLVLYHYLTAGGGPSPEIRVKVRFHDFKQEEGEAGFCADTLSMTKNVAPAEIQAAFSFGLDRPQR
ncbi:MAG: hypothetical protein HY537_07860, partial [Deltaproteobacteria bacterium]|nr:hypothetical protein [Deltaproteobacteria bacterium]